jgi:hypothetical protein
MNSTFESGVTATALQDASDESKVSGFGAQLDKY